MTIKEVELPRANSRKKAHSVIIDMDTQEVLIDASLTLPAVKRFMKLYAQYGLYTKATHDAVEVK